MNSLRLSRRALSVCVATLLAACGGSQPPIGAPGAVTRTGATVTRAAHGRSWMLPEAKTEDLLYASGAGNVNVYTYPGLKTVGAISNLNASTGGECVDTAGDIFVTTAASNAAGTILEFAHGSITPIAELSDPGNASGCSVDPKTGNLAVSNSSDRSNPSGNGFGDVAIYTHAQGSPTMYYCTQCAELFFCGYDSSGNLFVDGSDSLWELPSGNGSLVAIALQGASKYFEFDSAVQWDGQHMTIGNAQDRVSPVKIYGFSVSGSSARVITTTLLKNRRDQHYSHHGQYWIQGSRVAAISFVKGYSSVALWKYPTGGVDLVVGPKIHGGLQGVTVSLAPSR
jgi:hypothetical protein